MEFGYRLTGEKTEFPIDYSLVAEEKISSKNEIIFLNIKIPQEKLKEIDLLLKNPILHQKALEYSRVKLNYKYMYPAIYEAHVKPRKDAGFDITLNFKLYPKDEALVKINEFSSEIQSKIKFDFDNDIFGIGQMEATDRK